MNDSLIFIPDISGFTEFTKTTEINHSAHIVSDLLGIILENNKLGLDLIEVEGDALLFVKKNIVPTMAEIVEQAKEMYRAFHRHLLLYNHSRVCDCGACTIAPKLTLKFFAHQGEIVELKVGDITKYHGPDMILIHRLMKNNLKSQDYLLFSDSFNSEGEKALQLTADSIEYPIIGKVDYHFMDLKGERDKLVNQKIENKFDPIAKPYKTQAKSIEIEGSITKLSQDFGSLAVKEKVMSPMAWVHLTKQSMSYVGNEHKCLINGKNVRIITSELLKEDGKCEMTEEIQGMPLFQKTHKFYRLLRLADNKTSLTIEYEFEPKFGFLGKMMSKNLIKKLESLAENELKSMKKYYEA